MASMVGISVQVNAKDKELATKILQELGVTLSGLINMTLKQVIIQNGIPFDVKGPKLKMTKDMKEALKELKYIETHLDEYPHYHSREELKEALLSDD